MLSMSRDIVKQPSMEAGLPRRGEILVDRANARAPVPIERRLIFSPPEEAVHNKHSASGSHQRSEPTEPLGARKVTRAIYRNGGVEAVCPGDFQRLVHGWKHRGRAARQFGVASDQTHVSWDASNGSDK